MSTTTFNEDRKDDSIYLFFENFKDFSFTLGNRLANNFDKEQPDDSELASIYSEAMFKASESVGNEMKGILKTSDNETTALLARHIDNTGVNKMLGSITEKLKAGKFGAILGKISAILEIVKKILTQLLDKLEKWGVPKFIRKILGIILDLAEFLDNILPRILDLFGIKSEGNSKAFLASAESHFLSTHKSWRELHYNYNAD